MNHGNGGEGPWISVDLLTPWIWSGGGGGGGEVDGRGPRRSRVRREASLRRG